MLLPVYSYKINEEYLDYEFTSIGPKGSIKKVVRFAQIRKNVFNVAFGDLDKETGDINDISVTNNNDSRKVLMTVAAIIHDFLLRYPEASIMALGSTESRTRLYRIGIINYWNLINPEFEILGFKNNRWEVFQFKNTYDAFLIQRK